jgi:hypothetical protein
VRRTLYRPTDRCAMKNRLEYKYLVPAIHMDRLRTDLHRYLNTDEYAAARQEREYTVRSVYLDTHDYKCFDEKIDGLHSRKKFRIRGYNAREDNSAIFFEIKRKFDNFISKDRAKTSYAGMQNVLAGQCVETNFAPSEKSDYDHFFYHYHRKRLEPKVLIVYDREAFECKFGSQLRVTFDKNLRTKAVSSGLQMFEEHGLKVLHKTEFILEVKFFQVLPQWIRPVLEKYDLTRLAVSKYSSSIDAQTASLIRMNTFNRTIDN